MQMQLTSQTFCIKQRWKLIWKKIIIDSIPSLSIADALRMQDTAGADHVSYLLVSRGLNHSRLRREGQFLAVSRLDPPTTPRSAAPRVLTIPPITVFNQRPAFLESY